MPQPTPDETRNEVLRLSLFHDVPAAEVAARTGVKERTVQSIVRRARRGYPRRQQDRGSIVLLYDPREIFTPGARFNHPDMETMIELSNLADGTRFRVPGRDGAARVMEVMNGRLVEIAQGG